MIPSVLIEQVWEDNLLNYMLKQVFKFDKYLDDTNNMSIRIRGFQYGQYDADGQESEPLGSIYRSPEYDDDIRTWMMFGGDNEQYATLESLEFNKRMEKLDVEF